MPADWDIRRLGPADLAAMRALNALFAHAFNDRSSYVADPPGDDYLRQWLAREHVVALAGFAEGEVAGGLVAYELDKFEQARREIYIYDLAVAEGRRRRGLATALIGALCEHAQRRNAYVVFVQADYGDDPAIALYEKLGVREEVLHFDIAVARAMR